MSNTPSSSKFTFDTEFRVEGDLVSNAARARQRKVYAQEEIDHMFSKARAEGAKAGMVRAAEAIAAATTALAGALRTALVETHTEVEAIRRDAAMIAFTAARKLAPVAIAALPAGDVEAALREAIHQAIGEPRVVLRASQGVIEAIRRLRAADFPVAVSGSIDRLNIGSLADTYELMKGLDVQAWRTAAPQATGNWRGTTTASPLDEQAETCAPLLERWIKDGEPFAIQLGSFYRGSRARKPETDPAGQPDDQKPVAGRAGLRSRGRVTGLKRSPDIPDRPTYTPEGYDCGACREQPNLLPDGTLVPCPGYVDSILQDRMPNLLRDDLSEVWTRSFLR